MESLANVAVPSLAKLRVYSQELLPTFLQYADKIKVLSLDCFDTLLWRQTAIPADVFYDLQHQPTFKKYAINAVNRMDAEGEARRSASINKGIEEVKLSEVFRDRFTKVSETDIQALINEEITAEMETCYGFPPVIELMRAAHARGIKIIIVSNTYLEEPQLKKLLQNCLPQDVFASIAMIFCSCEYQKPKERGLFQDVLQKLKLNPNDILHVGDNAIADFEVPHRLGLHALNLIQFNDVTQEIFRTQSATAPLIDQMIRYQRGQYSPFRGLFSRAALALNKPETIIGYVSLGPIMYAFARYLQDEVAELSRAGKRPKILFMMRDAYLFSITSKAFFGESIGQNVHVSRFVSVASSFRTKEDIRNYLVSKINTWDMLTLCKQLLLPEKIVATVVKQVKESSKPTYTFCQTVLQDHIVKEILKNAKEYRERLKKYFQKNTDLQPGDTVLLVDIGYIGNVQTFITPFLMHEMQVEDVSARYLMLQGMPEAHYTRRGFVDTATSDARAIKMLCLSGFLFEELCCNSENSVIDFDREGNPIYSTTSVMEAQRLKVKAIQDECIRFIHDAKDFFQHARLNIPFKMLRDYALTEMGRRVFFPTKIELEYLKDFNHDADGGCDESFEIYKDPIKELGQLRKQGLTFDNLHTYGVRFAGYDLACTVMALKRYQFEVDMHDLSFRREAIKVVMQDNAGVREFLSQAMPTYDGFYALLLPVKNENTQIAVMLGLHYQFVQIDSIELIKEKYLLDKDEAKHKENILPSVFFNQMIDRGGRLYECSTSTSAFMASLTSDKLKNSNLVCRVVFRPVVMRELG